MSEKAEPVEIFFSYSHRDEELREELEKHLALLKREGLVRFWNDRMIGPGREWAGEISEHLESAQMILLLISPDFMASDYCHDLEMKRALERHEAGEAVVIPIILRPVDWRSASFARLQGLPKDGKAITLWENRDQAFTDVARGIRRAISKPRSSSAPSSQPQTTEPSPTQSAKTERKGGSQLKTLPKALWALGLLILLGAGLFWQFGAKQPKPSATFQKAETFLGRLHLRKLDQSIVSVDHRFQTGDYFRLGVDSNRNGWIYVFHRRPGGELKLLWPADPNEEQSNAIRAYEPLIVPSQQAFKFTEETGNEFFSISIVARPVAPKPQTETAPSRVASAQTAVRSLGKRRNVILARPEPEDPNLYFKASDEEIAVVEFSLRHEEAESNS